MRTCILFACAFLSTSSFAQYYNLPNNTVFNASVEKKLAKTDSSIHSGLQPYIPYFHPAYTFTADSQLSQKKGKWLRDVLFHRNFVDLNVDSGFFQLRINPIINLESGQDVKDTSGRNYYTNTRGIIGAGSIGKRFYFETMFSENQSVFPNYISTTVKALQVVPGQGRWKNFKTNGYDYAFSSGFFSFQVNSHLNIQAGHGKQKIGYGYRSLLLSDNALAYPYLRITQQWFKGKLQYTNIYAVFMNLVSASKIINPNSERIFQKKAASFQYLSFNPTKRINIGLFQSLICLPGDSTNTQRLDLQYANPIIFSNLLSYGLDKGNNINCGLDFRYKITSTFNLYGQFMLEHLSSIGRTTEAFAWQTGLNYHDAFGLRGLRLQAELTTTRGEVYRDSKGAINYTHYGQVLGYVPVEGTEALVSVFYRHKRFFAQAKTQYILHSASTTAENKINAISGMLGVVVNPSYNMQLSIAALVRTQNFSTFSAANTATQYFCLTFKTSIYNFYYDF